MLKSTEYNREDLMLLWTVTTDSREQSDVMTILKRLQPIILALFNHIDDLQAEVNGLRQRIERERV